MTTNDLPYPQRLLVQMLHFAVWSCEKTKDTKLSEIKAALAVFFTDEQIKEAQEMLEGHPTV